MTALSQGPPIEPGVSKALAEWRAVRYSDIRYKLDLTLEKMSPVLKGTIEIRVNVLPGTKATSPAPTLDGSNADARGSRAVPAGEPLIVLDWRKIAGHENDSTISNVTVNGKPMEVRGGGAFPVDLTTKPYIIEDREHLIIGDGVKMGENVIKLDFTSPILTSGSAITRYVDREDGSEYIYSLFVPSDASTAFPVFDQPDLKARFSLKLDTPAHWTGLSNAEGHVFYTNFNERRITEFAETPPFSTYVFAFAAGPFIPFASTTATDAVIYFDRQDLSCTLFPTKETKCMTPITGDSITTNIIQKLPDGLKFEDLLKGEKIGSSDDQSERNARSVRDLTTYVRKSQAAKFETHALETFRLTREAIKYFETYFDYKFPFPKYDLVLIPEFPFGGMEHAGATFLRESSVIFPSEPTKSDYISRATLIFHETAHQWFGDTVTMKWFDDLWLKEGFANFMAYKALEKIMPEANAWKVFYERIKQPAYATDSTRGTTAIYQPIANLSAAKSAYGNIVYNKAPAFLRQAEFYLGEDKFQTAVRAFLKKHEYANAGWEDLVGEFEGASGRELKEWARAWVTDKVVNVFQLGDRVQIEPKKLQYIGFVNRKLPCRKLKFNARVQFSATDSKVLTIDDDCRDYILNFDANGSGRSFAYIFPNYGDFGYGIFLLDDKSRDYVLKNIQNEKDPFLRSMMWGALWDSVREGELDPREYVELVIKQLGGQDAQARASARAVADRGISTTPPIQGGDPGNAQARASARAVADRGTLESDETIIQSLLGRVSTALNYYIADGGGDPSRSEGAQRNLFATERTLPTGRVSALRGRLEDVILDRMEHAATAGERITFFRAFVANATSEMGRAVLKQMLKSEPPAVAGGLTLSSAKSNNGSTASLQPPATAGGSDLRLRTKDRFDIVTRLAVLGDPEAPKLLADLEKMEIGDDAKRYAYAAHAAFATKENRERYWNDFVNNKDISESWIEAAMGPFNSIRHDDLSLPYLERALKELPNLKRNRKIFFVNGWLGAFIGGQRSQQALDIVNKFLADNPNLDNDLRLKVLENVDIIERAVKIRSRWK